MVWKLRMIRRLANVVLIIGLLLFVKTAYAQDGDESLISAIDTAWVLIAAFLVFFMQAGFGFLEAGFVRSKNVVNIMAENLMDTTMTTIGFIIAGFALMFGAGNGFFGTEWFFLRGIPDVYPGLTIPTLAFFFFQFAFCAAASAFTRFSSVRYTIESTSRWSAISSMDRSAASRVSRSPVSMP